MTPERLAEIKALAHAYSGLQYVATGAHLQWPWTSAASTNQVVDLVRAVPDLLAALAAASEREQAYRAALPGRQIRRVVTALMGDASDLHVLKKHGPYGSSFLDCTWGSCHLHRELIEVMERAAQALDGGKPDES